MCNSLAGGKASQPVSEHIDLEGVEGRYVHIHTQVKLAPVDQERVRYIPGDERGQGMIEVGNSNYY